MLSLIYLLSIEKLGAFSNLASTSQHLKNEYTTELPENGYIIDCSRGRFAGGSRFLAVRSFNGSGNVENLTTVVYSTIAIAFNIYI